MYQQRTINPYQHQRGVVLIIALFIVAIVTTLSYVMMFRLSHDTWRTQLLLHNVKAEFYAQGSLQWAMDQLRNNWEQKKEKQLIDVMPFYAPVKEEEGYQIKSTIYDLQARFNLNNLSDLKAQNDFKHLLAMVAPHLSMEKKQEITRAIMSWISPNQSNNEFSKYYSSLLPPYYEAHRPMVVRSELMLVKGMTSDLYAALEPYVVALPVKTAVNVQTASAVVLASLSETMSLTSAAMIINAREQAPFLTLEQFDALAIVRNHAILRDKIAVLSRYFLLETMISIEEQHLVIYTLLERITNRDKAVIHVLWQSKGIW